MFFLFYSTTTLLILTQQTAQNILKNFIVAKITWHQLSFEISNIKKLHPKLKNYPYPNLTHVVQTSSFATNTYAFSAIISLPLASESHTCIRLAFTSTIYNKRHYLPYCYLCVSTICVQVLVHKSNNDAYH